MWILELLFGMIGDFLLEGLVVGFVRLVRGLCRALAWLFQVAVGTGRAARAQPFPSSRVSPSDNTARRRRYAG